MECRSRGRLTGEIPSGAEISLRCNEGGGLFGEAGIATQLHCTGFSK